MPSVEALGEEIPAHQETGHVLVTALVPRGAEESKRTMKWRMMGSRDVGWSKGFGGQGRK